VKLSFVHYSLARGGGMERYLCDLLSGFRDAGDSRRVVVRRADRALAQELGPEIVELKTFSQPRLWAKVRFYLKAGRWLSEHSGEPTVALARVPGAKMVMCGGNHLGYLERIGRRRSFQDRLEIHMEKRAYATARIVVAHSQLMHRQLVQFYQVPAERLVMLYPPVDTKRFHAYSADERQGLRRQFGFTDERARLVFPSGNHLRKGLDLLVAALAYLPENSCEIVVAGGTPPRGLAGRVRYLGYVNKMEELYAAGDATVLPSRYEPFGLVYVESMLCGTPAVVPASAGAAEILKDAGPGAAIVPSLDAEAIAAAIKAVLASGRVTDTQFVDRHKLSVPAHVLALRELLEQF
jgi:glycosyltransferase involved in cell wall biosynthesis